MEKFLGILFCGGKGTRLGLITKFISKAFVPVYDRPVFMYPLSQLKESKRIDEIAILTNAENDSLLRKTGCPTIIQDDEYVGDMFSGLSYIRKKAGVKRPVVMMPCDNISDIRVDDIIDLYLKGEYDICFSLKQISDDEKIRQMGSFDPETETVAYKSAEPKSNLGVIAPYVVSADFRFDDRLKEYEIFNTGRLGYSRYDGYWIDIGDPESLAIANRDFKAVRKGREEKSFSR